MRRQDALAAQPHAGRYRLRLFVSGVTPRSARAIRNIRVLCQQTLPGRYDLEVIDVYQHPERVKPDQIIVTPTLVKELPLPLRKIVGDLSDKRRLLARLDLVASDPSLQPARGHYDA